VGCNRSCRSRVCRWSIAGLPPTASPRQSSRSHTLAGQPDLHHGARFPLGVNPDLATAAVERDRRAANQLRQPSHQAVGASRVSDRDTDLLHQVLRFEASSPTARCEVGQVLAPPALLGEDVPRGSSLGLARCLPAPIRLRRGNAQPSTGASSWLCASSELIWVVPPCRGGWHHEFEACTVRSCLFVYELTAMGAGV